MLEDQTMAIGKVLLYLGENNYINNEFWWCPPLLLNSWMSKLQKEAIVKPA